MAAANDTRDEARHNPKHDPSLERNRTRLLLDILGKSGTDVELCTYNMLSVAREGELDFYRNLLYPSIRTVTDLYSVLTKFTQSVQDARSLEERELVGVDLEEMELLYVIRSRPIPEIETLLEAWDTARPRIGKAVMEGARLHRAIFDRMELVVHYPLEKDDSFVEHGYIMIPHNLSLHLYEYALGLGFGHDSMEAGPSGSRISLRGLGVHELPAGSDYFLESRKQGLMLMKKHGTRLAFFCDAGPFESFPLERTLRPLAIHKLLDYVDKMAQVPGRGN